jgi:uncharacterized membrane protein YdjX (TVP38/TMEM64 family)
MSLRTGVLCGALAILLAAIGGVLTGHFVLWFLVLEAGAAAGLIVFERSRYGSREQAAARAGFEPTDERFIDPTTGRETVVHYNPLTGEREYRT